ncbi:hypothetical protein Pla100_12940 [Neorhodopirellula pilleata]|uniref:Uncharacterized protein n=1 Tax=Neorhodopirellula pilleata TaxID=2714738 RepID=A0A5C6AQR5_9BACT|nr:hypothetical protein Pla100_12940 [Neorhodopirellula pilleata]
MMRNKRPFSRSKSLPALPSSAPIRQATLWEGRAKRGEGYTLDLARNPPRPEAGRPSQREGEVNLREQPEADATSGFCFVL